ncbi:hypothetical protein QBS70_16675 [Cronobacter sakazakii]|nr:hypothetical protein [Cronobacter sakazakii]
MFEGPPDELASLLPDTDDEMIWTLSDSQNYAKAHNTAVFLVCQYQGTAKKNHAEGTCQRQKMYGLVWE